MNQDELQSFLNRMNRSSDQTQVNEKEYILLLTQQKQAEIHRLELENKRLEGYNQGDSEDRAQRKVFALRIFSFVCYYMFFVGLIIFLCGCPNHFHLSDTVLITLLGTTTANVIGIFVIVVTYLFSKNQK